MIKLKISVILFCSFLLSILLSGCGRLGENEVEAILQKIYKDKLISSSYSINENAKLAQTQIIIRTSSGKEVIKTEYFFVSENKDKNKVFVRRINTAGVPQKLINELTSKYPSKFKEYIDLYNDLESLYEECDDACSQYENDYYSHLKTGKYLGVSFLNECIKKAVAVNGKIAEYENEYDDAPLVVQNYLSYPPDYFHISYDKNHYYTDRRSTKP